MIKGYMTDEAPGLKDYFMIKQIKPITEKLEEVGALLKLTLLLTPIHMIGERKNQLFSGQLHNGLLPLKISVKNY